MLLNQPSGSEMRSTGSKKEKVSVTKTVSETTGKKKLMAQIVEASSRGSERFQSNTDAKEQDLPNTQRLSYHEDELPPLSTHNINIPL